MMRPPKPSPAIVIALFALVVAMAGTGLAATSYIITSSSQIKDGAVTSADVKNSSLTGNDIKDKSLSAKDFAGSVQGPTGPAGPAGPAGAKGDSGAPGTALAYGHVLADGSFVAQRSKGVNGIVPLSPPGAYCIDLTGLSPSDLHTVTATLTLEDPRGGEIATALGVCTYGSLSGDLVVRTYDSAGALVPHAFDVVVN